MPSKIWRFHFLLNVFVIKCGFFCKWECFAYCNAKDIYNYNANIYDYSEIINNYSEIITIQLASYLNLKSVNWNFANNRLTARLVHSPSKITDLAQDKQLGWVRDDLSWAKDKSRQELNFMASVT